MFRIFLKNVLWQHNKNNVYAFLIRVYIHAQFLYGYTFSKNNYESD